MRRALIAILLAYIAIYVVPLGVRPLQSPDETRYAEIPREMIATGDWIVPRLDGLRYFEKPPLGYWVTALSMLAFGENGFAVRFPSAVASGLTALILLCFANRVSGRQDTGPLAGVVYLTSLLVFVVGTSNIPDGPFTLLLTATCVLLYRGLAAEDPAGRTWRLTAAGLCCGLAFLTKGLLAFALPLGAVVVFCAWERRWRDIPWSVGLPAAVAVAVALPWSLAIHLREPDFWRYFVWVEHLQRFLAPRGDEQHAQPVWYFVPVLLASQLFWVPFVPAAIAGRRHHAWPRSPARWCVVWAVVPFVVVSASGGKLATYILPSLPPLALLLAVGLTGAVTGRERSWSLVSGAWVAAGIGLGGLAYALAAGRSYYSDSEGWKVQVLAVGFACWAVMSAVAALANRLRLAIHACAPLLLFVCTPWAVPADALATRTIRGITENPAAKIARDALLVADRRSVTAACWILKRHDIAVLDHPGELAYGASYADAGHRLLGKEELAALVDGGSRERDVVLLLARHDLVAWAGETLTRRHAGPDCCIEDRGILLARLGT